MATVSQVTEATFEGRFKDAMSGGADAAAASMEKLAAKTEAAGGSIQETEQKVTRSAPSWNALGKRYDEAALLADKTAAANRRLATETEAARQAVARGDATQAQADETVRRATITRDRSVADAQKSAEALRKSYGGLADDQAKVGTGAKVTGQQISALIPQLNDLGTQMASGGGLFLPLIQQAGQIIPIFGGVKQTLAAIPSLLSAAATAMGPLGVAATVVGAAVVGLTLGLTSQQTRMADLRSELRAVTTDYANVAKEVDAVSRRIAASGIGVSRGQADAAQVALRTAAPAGSNFDFEALTRQAADFARMMGGDVVAAAGKFASAMRDPAAFVREMAEKNVPGFTQALVRTVEVMQNGGDRATAFGLAMGRMNEVTQGAARDVASLTAGTRTLSTAWESFKGAIDPWVETGGKALLYFFTNAVNGATGLVRALGAIGGALPNLIGAGAANRAANSTFGDAELDTFGQRLIQRESNGDPRVVNQFGYTGLYQFGTGALQAAGLYAPAPGESLATNQWRGTLQIPGFPEVRTQDDFRNNAAAQQAAFRRHIEGLSDGLDRVPGNENFSRSGLLAIAHGYGSGAASEFVRNGGRSDRADGNGARLDETYRRFAEAATTAATSATAAANAAGAAAQTTTARPNTPEDELRNRAYKIVRGEDGRVDPLSSTETQRRVIAENERRLREAQTLPGNSVADNEAFTRGLEAQRRAYEATRGAAEQMIQTERDRQTGLAQLDPVQRHLTEQVVAYRNAQRAKGDPVDPAEEARIQAAALRTLELQYREVTSSADRQAQSAGRVATAYRTSTEAGRHQENFERALIEVRQRLQGTDEQRNQAAELLARKYDDIARAATQAKQAEQNRTTEDELALLQREGELIGASAEAREREVAAMRARQQAARQGIGGTDEARQAEQLATRLVEVRQQNAQLTNSWNELSRIGEQAFDRIGSAITEAFTNGSGKAVNFGNIAKAVFSEVIQAGLKLAIINPVLNSVFGGNRGTLGGIATVAGGGTVTKNATEENTVPVTNGQGGVVGYAQQASNAYSLYSKLSANNPGDYISGARGFNTGFDFADNFLNTPTGIGAVSTATQTAATTTALEGLGAGVYGPATPGSVAAAGGAAAGEAGLSIGGAAAGVAGIAGGAYGIYSGLQRGGPGGYTSAAGGAVTAGLSAAAMAGAVIPVYGWIAAAVLMIVGALLPGAKPSNKEGNATLDLASGVIKQAGAEGSKFSQENRDTASKTVEALRGIADNVGKAAGVEGGKLAGSVTVGYGDRDGAYIKIGDTRQVTGTDEAGAKAMALTAAQHFLKMALEQTTDDNAKKVIRASGVEDAERTLGNLQWYQDTYKTFGQVTDAASAFDKQMQALVLPFDEVAAKAREFGLAEDAIQAKRAEAVSKAYADRTSTVQQIERDMASRSSAARGASVEAFNVSQQQAAIAAKAELDAFQKTLEDLGLTTKDVTARVAVLAAVQGQEAAARERNRPDPVALVRNTELALTARSAAANGVSATAFTVAQQQAAIAAAAEVRDFQASLEGLGLTAADVTMRVNGLRSVQQQESDARVRAYQEEQRARASQIRQSDLDIGLRVMVARGDAAGVWRMQQTIASKAAEDELVTLRRTLEGLGVTAADVSARVETLASVQAEEAAARIAAHEKEAQQERQNAAGTAYGVVTGLRSYVQGLSTSDAAPGTVLDRLEASRRQFDAVYGAAQAGDARSIEGVQGYAETYRGLAREVYGGGQGYTDAVQMIGDRLGAITDLGADALTASFYAEQATLNTDRVVDGVTDLRAEIVALRRDLNLAMSRPVAA